MSNFKILTARQQKFLDAFSKTSDLSKIFYLSGGTTLAEYYIPYRYSEDLDFFSDKDIETEPLIVFTKSLKNSLNYNTFDFNTSFNRNLIFLNFGDEVLKTEFTYFPFTPIENPKLVNGVLVDSVLDIAVNKLFTIYQKPRSRDFMDLYMIINKYPYSLENIISKAKSKFDWNIDPIKLGTQFLLAKELKDYPKLMEPIDENKWQAFFEEAAKNLGERIFE